MIELRCQHLIPNDRLQLIGCERLSPRRQQITHAAAKNCLSRSLRFRFERVAFVRKPTNPAIHVGKAAEHEKCHRDGLCVVATYLDSPQALLLGMTVSDIFDHENDPHKLIAKTMPIQDWQCISGMAGNLKLHSWGLPQWYQKVSFAVFQLRVGIASPQGLVADGWCRHRLAAFRP